MRVNNCLGGRGGKKDIYKGCHPIIHLHHSSLIFTWASQPFGLPGMISNVYDGQLALGGALNKKKKQAERFYSTWEMR